MIYTVYSVHSKLWAEYTLVDWSGVPTWFYISSTLSAAPPHQPINLVELQLPAHGAAVTALQAMLLTGLNHPYAALDKLLESL